MFIAKLKVGILCLILSTLTSCSGGGDEGKACDALRKFSGRIAEGESCSEGQPNVAFLLMFDATQTPYSECTGSYVSRTEVLTAAHCLTAGPAAVVVASRDNLHNGTQYFIHPLYNGSVDSPFDLAIVRVDQPLNSTPLPVLLSRSPVAGEEVVAYGYGTDESGNEAISRIESGEDPLKATFTIFTGYSQGSAEIVSTGAGSTCQGDSGGPVVAKDAAGNYGIIGVTRAGPEGCGAAKGRPSFLSSTQSQGALDFLEQHVPDLAVN